MRDCSGAKRTCQVAVVGGGPAGLATALGLVSRPLSVTLIERSDYTGVRFGEHLPPSAISSLRQLDVPEGFFSSGHRPCPGVRSAWGAAHLDDNSYIFHPDGDGFNLSRPAFDASLAELARHRGARLLLHTRLRKLKFDGNAWHLELSTPAGAKVLRADFLVDAGGRTAAAARMLGRKLIAYDRLVGFIGFLSPSKEPSDEVDDRLLIEAVEKGWWYVCGLGENRAVAAYMTDSDYELGPPLEVWSERLKETTHVKERLRGLRLASPVEVRSARSQRLDRMTGERWLAVGDAAMGFDPLSSQGIAKGLSDGLRAAGSIWDHLNGDAAAMSRLEFASGLAFRDYLQTRSYYYRMEGRWPDSRFWHRRRSPLPGKLAVTIDPTTIVAAPETICAEQVRGSLKEVLRGIDCELMVRLAQSPQQAHRLVSRIKAEAHDRPSDREIILAIQALIEAGFLVQASLENA